MRLRRAERRRTVMLKKLSDLLSRMTAAAAVVAAAAVRVRAVTVKTRTKQVGKEPSIFRRFRRFI